MYNKYAIHNWHYIGLPELLPLRYFGYAWSFATIWPAIFETGDLVSSLRDRRAPPDRASAPRRHDLGPWGWLSVIAGAGMLVAADRLPVAVSRRPGVPGICLPARSAEREDGRGIDPRRPAPGPLRPVDQPAAGGAGLRVRLGVVELLGRREVDYTACRSCPSLRIFEMPVPGTVGFRHSPSNASRCT